MKKELQEQLGRCKAWLEQEPNDIEVIEKAKELEQKINELEQQEEQQKLQEKKEKLYNEILDVEKQIRAERRDANFFYNFGKQHNVNPVGILSLCAGSMETLVKKHQKLVEEYKGL